MQSCVCSLSISQRCNILFNYSFSTKLFGSNFVTVNSKTVILSRGNSEENKTQTDKS